MPWVSIFLLEGCDPHILIATPTREEGVWSLLPRAPKPSANYDVEKKRTKQNNSLFSLGLFVL